MSETSNEFDYSDLTPIEIPVTNLNGKNYILREADGDTGAKFKSRSAQCMRMTEGKVSGVNDIGSLEPYLLSLCMLQVSIHTDGETKHLKSVSEATIRSWPSKVVKKLFNKAKEISELNEEETVESLEKVIKEATKKLKDLRGESVKNESDDTTGGLDSPLT